MVSRDGVKFHRYQEALIRTTDPEDRGGNRSNYMAWGLVRLPGDKEWSVYAKEAYYTGTGSRLRRFSFRQDGLVALTAGADSGEAVTKLLSFSGKRLVVEPGCSFAGRDAGVYSVFVVRGSGTYGGLEVRGGEPGLDELVVTHDRATRGVEVRNTGAEDLEAITFFGPDVNADVPTIARR